MQILCYPKYSVLNNSPSRAPFSSINIKYFTANRQPVHSNTELLSSAPIAEDPGSVVSECGTYNQTFSSLTVECEAREASSPATQPSTTFIFHIQNAHSQVTFMSIIYRV